MFIGAFCYCYVSRMVRTTKMRKAKIRVAVIMGGPSAEHEVSLKTGRKIIQTLAQEKYLIQPVVVTKDRKWLRPPLQNFLSSSSSAKNATEVLVPTPENQALREIKTHGVDVVFIAMHGEFGEDGTIQGLLESIGLPYTGSGVLASALGMDKPRSLAIFRDAGLRVPDFFEAARTDWGPGAKSFKARALKAFGLPLVIKPANRGSSVGVDIVQDQSQIELAADSAFSFSDRIMLQKYVAGTEVTCGVIEAGDKTIPLQPTQIVPKTATFFDYYSKYTPGATEEVTPPRLPQNIIQTIQTTALRAHQSLGCSGMSRTDMILGDDSKLYVLEINTIPGMTETSLLPQAAQAVGISFPELLDLIIESGLKKR